MPKISEFYGIVIRMNIHDHPPPHFHAYYGSEKASICIRTGNLLVGSLPQRAWRLVREWQELHRGELEENWTRCESGFPLLPIDPL